MLSSFYRGELAELRRISIGPDLVFGRLWRETGCGEVISALLADRRFGFDVERAIYLTVLHRLMVSGSDRHASRWHHGFRIPGSDGLTLDHAYRAMAWLGEDREPGRTTTDVIEEMLYRQRQELFGDISIAFFDTTSLYFEGAGGETLGQFGHSKDYRGHLKQVVLGMVLDGADRPFASFLWPGNTTDVTRLMPVVERLRQRFGITRVCVVADRGMVSATTIAALEKAGIEYILGVRERSNKEVRDEVIEDDGVTVPLLLPRQKGETQLAKGFRRFVRTIASGNFSIDYDKAAADAKFDGVFVLRTNCKLSALQVALRYRNLLAVEDTFKTAKDLLATRPIFHKTDAAIRGHIFCSFLATFLRKELLDRLAARKRPDLEWRNIIDDLDELSEIEVEQDGRRALLRTAPGPTIDPICRALGITLPPVVQELLPPTVNPA